MKGLKSVVEVAMEVERMAHISGDWQRRWRERVGLVGLMAAPDQWRWRLWWLGQIGGVGWVFWVCRWLGFLGSQVVVLCLVAKKMFSKMLSVYMSFDVFEHERERYIVDVQDLGSYILPKKKK